MLAWDCNPTVLAKWPESWFTASSINPSEHQRIQLINFIRLKLYQGWSLELRDFVELSTTSIKNLEVIKRKVQKKNFPDLMRTTNLFLIQPLQPG